MTKTSKKEDVTTWSIRLFCQLWTALVSVKSCWKEYSIATKEYGHDQMTRLITKYTLSNLAMKNISYDGETHYESWF